MILPASYAVTLGILILSMICWGSWANTLKLSKWRFELFYIDFSLGAVLMAVVSAFTFGSMGTDISVPDQFLLSSKTAIGYAFLGGTIFNLANMLLVAAIELAGLSVAFPIGIGLALIVGVTWNYAMQQTGNVAFLAVGCVLVLLAVILNARALAVMEEVRRKLAAKNAPPEPLPAMGAPGSRSSSRKKEEKAVEASAMRGVWFALAAGLLMGAFYPIVRMSQAGELGLANPYAVALVFSIGVFASTFIYNLYFMNLPVKGMPVSPFAYFTGNIMQHALGILGGAVWMLGTVTNFVASAATGAANVGPAVSYGLGQGAAFVSLLWGLFVWREFAGAPGGVNRLLMIMTLLFLAGLTLVAIAPLK